MDWKFYDKRIERRSKERAEMGEAAEKQIRNEERIERENLLGKLNEAKKLAEKLCTGMFSNSVELWALRLSIDMICIQNQSHSPAKDNLSFIYDLLRNVLTEVAISEAEKLWLMTLRRLAQNGEQGKLGLEKRDFSWVEVVLLVETSTLMASGHD